MAGINPAATNEEAKGAATSEGDKIAAIVKVIGVQNSGRKKPDNG
jgi:hypothetical protein